MLETHSSIITKRLKPNVVRFLRVGHWLIFVPRGSEQCG